MSIMVTDSKLDITAKVQVRSSTIAKIELTLDFNATGRLIGIEILDFSAQAENSIVFTDPLVIDGYGNVSYDKTADVLYVDLREKSVPSFLASDNSVDQLVVMGNMSTDISGQYVNIIAEW